MVVPTSTEKLDICFVPAVAQTVFSPLETFAVFAIANRPDAQIEVSTSDGDSATFNLIKVPSIGGGYYTFTTTIKLSGKPTTLKYSYLSNGEKINLDGYATVVPKSGHSSDEEYSTVVELKQQQDSASVKIPWLNIDDWQGWAWVRPRATWIEPRWVPLRKFGRFGAHFLMLQPVNHSIDPASTLSVFPCSSAEATVHLTGPRDGEEPGIYARVRRTKGSAVAKVYVVGQLATSADVFDSVNGAITLAKKYLGTTDITYYDPPAYDRGIISPFSQLGFCTWSSIGEHIRPTAEKLRNLVKSLKSAGIPIGSFIIDDGWQDTRHGYNGPGEKMRGLWGFDIWAGMDASFKDTVSIIKDGLDSVENVGVWMALHAYWNSIASESPLVAKYKMRPFKLSPDCVPGIKDDGFDDIQTLYEADEKDQVWWLPPKELAYQFWKDYFAFCADAGITFVKIDDQSFSSFLAGVEGAEEAFALWDGMNRAANEVFGVGRVIHCMAHYERTFNGDIGMGLATNGMRVVFRNTDDFGLERPNVHRDHIHYNLMNCIITSRMTLIPDADMFMSGAQWADYHAVLRAFFPGPVLLSDKAGEHDLRVIHKLIAKTTSGHYELVKSHQAAEPLSSRIWEPSLDSGIGPAIKAGSYFPAANSSSLVMWSSRDGATSPSTDVLLPSDILDLLGPHILEGTKYALWFSEMQKMVTFANTSILDAAIPLAGITLQPECHEIIIVAPFYKVGNIEIAPLGLLNKYAGLAAIADTKVGEEALELSILFEGELGLIVTDSSNLKVSVNGQPVIFTSAVLSRSATLALVDLKYSEEVKGSDYWTVKVSCA
ncbi:glycoside hydrolase superfamily [Lipomyces kononenkoae]|uniref:Glycoside hydrolase superfamily n=1 Tax=Lipomyces kononenkoae TaxID=34357 RepID=A0ACC3STP3_LIPKO